MSDLMLYGVLRMPYDMAMSGEISRLQFYNRAQQAADRLQAAEKELGALRAALESRQGVAVPAGWALVPVEPTGTMKDAGAFSALPVGVAEPWLSGNVYRAMLAAAPQPPAVKEAAPADPLDTPLPCDITVGACTMRAGVPLRTLVARMEVLHSMAMESPLAQRAVQAPLVTPDADGAPCGQCGAESVPRTNCGSQNVEFVKHCACGQGVEP